MTERMAKQTDRQISGRYRSNRPRKVRFSTQSGTRETTCLTDVVRDLISRRVSEASTEWNASDLARQMGLAASSLHAVMSGTRDPNLTHLERLAALGRSTALEVLYLHPGYLSDDLIEQVQNGENPFADLRLRGNLNPEQIERIGRVFERAAVTGNAEWLVAMIEQVGVVLDQMIDGRPRRS